MLILTLAIRNLFRNTRRTLLTILLIATSLSALILTDALSRGMTQTMVENLTHTLAGEAQIHRQGFRDNFSTDLYIADVEPIENQLAQDSRIAAYANRVISGGMISSTYNISAGLIYGVDAAAERQVSKLEKAVTRGNYLSESDAPPASATEIMIGEPLADLLEVGLGDRIVITLAAADTGELAQALFRVSGIFLFGTREIDENLVFINLTQARKLLEIKGSHEIAVRFNEQDNNNVTSASALQHFNTPSIEALGWRALNPEIDAMLDMTGYSTLIVGTILFLLASLGVINAMFMSIYERIYEFGVAKAIGTRPSQLFVLIMTEALLLALISCLVGMLLAAVTCLWFAETGIPLGDMEISGVAMSDSIPTVMVLSQFTSLPLYVLALIMVATLYPARFAARITPTDALHRSL
ncbi:MAG: ABC-type lipoprotein release transport system permease subunit [Candidatus Azotimanducaceae bacterium]|jgi:ABC-type lipoprotein release transport system permease subunit